MKSNKLKVTAGGTATGLTILGIGQLLQGKGMSSVADFAKANEIKLALANNNLLEIIIRQNEELIKSLRRKKEGKKKWH